MAGHLAGQPGVALAQAMRGRQLQTAVPCGGTHSARRRPRRTPPSAMFTGRQSREGDLQVAVLKILGLDERSSGVALARAIGRLSDAPPHEGLSRTTTEMRLQVLADIQDALSSSTRGRGTLSASVTLPSSLALGVAALLCDSAHPGDAAAALEAAGRVTQRQAANDVAIMTARANLTLAQAALKSSGAPSAPSPAARAYDHLRAAAQALASAGNPPPAPRLAADVAQALSDTMPAAARDALAQPPTPDTAAARTSAVQAVRELMRAGNLTTEYVTGLLRHLTAPEAAALLSWTCEPGGNSSAVAPQILTAAASAMLATALTGRQPHLAEALLRSQQLQKGPLDRFAPERAIAALLLGEPKTAIDILEAAAGKSRESNSAAALKTIAGAEFGVTPVKDMERDTLLAGLCAWAEEWLRSTALSEWQDGPVRSGPLLVPYFDTPEVAEYLRRRGTSLRGSIAQQLGKAAIAIAALPSQLLAPFAQRTVAPAPPPPQPLMPMSMTAAQRAAAAVAADKAAKVVAVDTVPATSPRPRYDDVGLMDPPTGTSSTPPATPIRMTVPSANTTAAAAVAPLASAAAPAGDAADSKEPVSYGELMRRKRERIAAAGAGAATPAATVRPRRAADATQRAAPTRRDPMSGGSAARGLPQDGRAGAIAAVGVATALALGCAAVLLRGRLHLLHFPQIPQGANVAAQQQQRAAGPAVTNSGHARMTSLREAERLIRDWQRVKSAAMGRNHELDGLNRLLGGPLLDEWRSRAEKAKSSQFCWRFSHKGKLRVTRLVGGTPAGAPAAVEAVLREAGTLVDERDGKAVDTYDSQYTVRYLLEDSGSGYRLTRAAVLEAEPKDA